MICVTDTHALIWHLGGSSRLGTRAKAVLAEERIVVPSTRLAEASFLREPRRVQIGFEEIVSFIQSTPQVSVHPLDIPVAAQLPPQLNIHDGIIVATALVLRERGEEVAVITRNGEITRSGLVPVIW
ncbi:MAG: hypothetical protein GHCLOJNM_03585 [bacterium]|nr:hypothetical protein [bacterium]